MTINYLFIDPTVTREFVLRCFTWDTTRSVGSFPLNTKSLHLLLYKTPTQVLILQFYLYAHMKSPSHMIHIFLRMKMNPLVQSEPFTASRLLNAVTCKYSSSVILTSLGRLGRVVASTGCDPTCATRTGQENVFVCSLTSNVLKMWQVCIWFLVLALRMCWFEPRTLCSVISVTQ